MNIESVPTRPYRSFAMDEHRTSSGGPARECLLAIRRYDELRRRLHRARPFRPARPDRPHDLLPRRTDPQGGSGGLFESAPSAPSADSWLRVFSRATAFNATRFLDVVVEALHAPLRPHSVFDYLTPNEHLVAQEAASLGRQIY